jgi:hypothetical protein
MKISGNFSREGGSTQHFRVLFDLPRESKKTPYQVFVLGFQLAMRQLIRDLAKCGGHLSALCARVHGLKPTNKTIQPLRIDCKINREQIAERIMAPALRHRTNEMFFQLQMRQLNGRERTYPNYCWMLRTLLKRTGKRARVSRQGHCRRVDCGFSRVNNKP